MKKLLFGAIIIATVLALSCKSAPAPAEESPAAAPEESGYDADDALERTYDAYRSKIILDGAKKYIVVPGDSLSRIALANYGGANHYGYFFPLIMMASPDAGVADPELIEPGMELTIPDLQKNLNDPGARAAIKDFLLEVAKIYDTINKAHSALTKLHLTILSDSL